ncbi:response regulator [Winogradskyella sp. 3972H.M.0a.05]|uniref:LytR/AlgR family response regulator transcription factor n=1 Tax=Winogradskyella sp. 3972H.M.0a.05 TaxID=2950277 RepID=UPI003393E183
MLRKIESLPNNISIFIVEDEPLISATIETALRKAGFRVIGDSDNFEDAIQSIKSLNPDLVLIDIQLEGHKDGIQLAQELDTIFTPYLYLTSQTDPETVDRVKNTNPLGYIVKPFTEAGLRSNIELAWHNYSKDQGDFILIKSSGKYFRINQKDILYLKAFDNYCYVVTKAKEYLLPHTLKHTYEQLNNELFVKVHRSYVVNIYYIQSIEKNKIKVYDTDIPLSASQKTNLRIKLGYT